MKVIITKRADGTFRVGTFMFTDFRTGEIFPCEEIVAGEGFEVPDEYQGRFENESTDQGIFEEPLIKKWIEENS